MLSPDLTLRPFLIQQGYFSFQRYIFIKRLHHKRHFNVLQRKILQLSPTSFISLLSSKELKPYHSLRSFIEENQIGEPLIWI